MFHVAVPEFAVCLPSQSLEEYGGLMAYVVVVVVVVVSAVVVVCLHQVTGACSEVPSGQR